MVHLNVKRGDDQVFLWETTTAAGDEENEQTHKKKKKSVAIETKI